MQLIDPLAIFCAKDASGSTCGQGHQVCIDIRTCLHVSHKLATLMLAGGRLPNLGGQPAGAGEWILIKEPIGATVRATTATCEATAIDSTPACVVAASDDAAGRSAGDGARARDGARASA